MPGGSCPCLGHDFHDFHGFHGVALSVLLLPVDENHAVEKARSGYHLDCHGQRYALCGHYRVMHCDSLNTIGSEERQPMIVVDGLELECPLEQLPLARKLPPVLFLLTVAAFPQLKQLVAT